MTELPEIKKITDRISYIDCCDKPLSSHIGIVYGDSAAYLFDVGSTLPDLEYLYSIDRPFDIVTSHFHADHIWWLTDHFPGDADLSPDDKVSTCYRKPSYRNLFVSAQTLKYTHDGIVVNRPVTIEDGVRLSVIPMPSSHAKGCLALMVDDTYLFMGDSTYSAGVDGRQAYNVQKLKEEIDLLETLPATKLLLSHETRFVRPKAVVLRQLHAVYDRRVKNEPYIYIT